MPVIDHDNDLQSWGRVERFKRTIIQSDALRGSNVQVLPFGNGRSYGDSCHSDNGVLLNTRSNAQIHSFDPQSGVLNADAGVLLVDVLRHTHLIEHFLDALIPALAAFLAAQLERHLHILGNGQ